ncbi:MAG: cupin domain-containing protein [Desulfobulbaceae bacterium]
MAARVRLRRTEGPLRGDSSLSGRGALALIRVSGPQAAACISRVCPDLCFDDSRRATLTTIIDAAGEQLDRAVAVAFPGPRSYTGEDMLTHSGEEGGVVVEGELEVTVAGQTWTLGPGDAYYFDSRLPHRFRNTGKVPARIVSANTPPTI